MEAKQRPALMLTAGDLAEILRGRLAGAPNAPAGTVTTDSRDVPSGSVFIALRGERFDGHDFVEETYQLGASVAVVEREPARMPVGAAAVVVADTGQALLDIAGWYRMQLGMPVVGITGSVGKTSTKELVAAVLSQRFATCKTPANHNNEIGLPQTVLGCERGTQALVLEMAMRAPGEIERLSRCARPDIALITCIGTSHIGRLGSRENIKKAKFEILRGLKPGGAVVLNGDDPYQWMERGSTGFTEIFTAVDNRQADIYAADIRLTPEASEFTAVDRHTGDAHALRIPVSGRHHVSNALQAYAVGRRLGLTAEEVRRGLAAFENTGSRQHIYGRHGVTIVEDCYNASPEAMEASLAVLAGRPERRKIAVIGDMLELGDYAAAAHYKAGAQAAKAGSAYLLVCGDWAEQVRRGALDNGMAAGQVFTFAPGQHREIARQVTRVMRPGDAVLFKASRLIGLEKAIAAMDQVAEESLENQ